MAAFDNLYVASSPRLLEQELRMLKQPSESTLASVEELDKTLLFKGLIDSPFRVDSIVDSILCDKPVESVLSTKGCAQAVLEWFKINRKSILWSVAVGEIILAVSGMVYYVRTGKTIDGYSTCDAICNSVLAEFDICSTRITSYQLQTTVARKMLERVWVYMSDTASQYLTDISLGKTSRRKDSSSKKRAKKGVEKLYDEGQALRLMVRECILDGDIELLEERIIEAIDVHSKSKGSRLVERKATLRRPTYICNLSSTRSAAYNALAVADSLLTLSLLGTIVDTDGEAATRVLNAIEEGEGEDTLDISKESNIARRTVVKVLKNGLGAKVCEIALYNSPQLPEDDAPDAEIKRFIVDLLGNVSLKDVQRGAIGVETAARMLAEYVNIPTAVIGRMNSADIKTTLVLCILDRRQFVRGLLSACIATVQLYSANSDTISTGVKLSDRLSSTESTHKTKSRRKPAKYIQRREIRRKRHLSAPVNSVTFETILMEQKLPLIVLSTPRGSTYPDTSNAEDNVLYGGYYLSAFAKELIKRHSSLALEESFYDGYDGVIGCRTKLELNTTPLHPPYSDRYSIESCISRTIGASTDFSITLGDPLWRVIALDRELIRAIQNDTPYNRVVLRLTEWEEKPEYIHTVIGESR